MYTVFQLPVGMYAAPNFFPARISATHWHPRGAVAACAVHTRPLTESRALLTNQIRTPVTVMEKAREKATESWTRSSFLRLLVSQSAGGNALQRM